MFVDASAIVAILTREQDADTLADILDTAPAAITSPIAVFEAVLAVRRKRQSTVGEAEDDVREFIGATRIKILPVTASHAHEALVAHAKYGKGQGHAAQLNLGDCFAYASAKINNVPLLFKGDDFTKTDIVSAGQTGGHR
jgi:ribonuclease VapC